MKQNLIGAICLSLAASMWGGMYVVSKYVLDYIPPLTLVWLRYVIAFVVLFVVLKIIHLKNDNRTEIKKSDWLLIAWIGFIGYFVSIAFQFIGTKLSDAHTGALITSATPAFIVVFARFILKEKLTVRKITSVLLATLGVVIVIGWDTKVGTYFLGTIILVGAAITWALLSVYVKVASKRLSSLAITTYAVFFALVFTTPAFVWELQSNDVYYQNTLIILGVIYLGVVSTAGAFFLWNKGMELMDAGVGSLFFFFQPLVGSFLGWLLLNEKLDVNFFIGGFLIMAGVVVVSLQKKKTM
ncbi:DMT(drug/metabolite transporter) superfamily permease [Schinkia azotoformans MEV2011]|uniref:DMT(Drug/metabolite transporter) superfamily permease n=1 Tax=Schinkia azotoformans MEV2011 TaxID=1348973 RepID=A0A072NLL6_SCHAZ|nr:EamA family transporter [Schinkia azotoformans]KEF38569.1 DMT(drug/metabolite transporter) superfamily permease [Schinkia azotoformans MEV2011]MEC1695177.1 EamA family transporter [Schinkia azotoformans]MEC1717579.1 EamA family transporter [Schinkia azotoformans]MEC1723764.1 EamA family transporter [Schinkia azotoformans]MEC1742316.1 EamA family transporter [Schinkia azotoformans]